MFMGTDEYESWFVFIGMFIMSYVYYRRTYGDDDDGRPPTLRSFPFIGSLLSLPSFQKMHIWFMNSSDKLGNVIGFYFGSKYAVILQSREVINDAFIKKSIDFAGRPTTHSLLLINPHLNGIIDRSYSDGFKKYHQLALNILREFGFGKCVMEDRIRNEVEDMVLRVRTLKGEKFDPANEITGCVMNVIASILFGNRFSHSDPKLYEGINYIHKLLNETVDITPVEAFPCLRFLPTFRKRLTKLSTINNGLLEFLKTRIAETLSDKESSSFVRRFCEIEGPNYDRSELLYAVRDLCIAGAETSATTLRWAVAIVANHPDIQQRLQDEIDSVIPRDRLPSLGDRPNLPYVEAAILEVMRTKTIIPLSVPRQTLCDTYVGGYFIPAGTMVFPNIYAVHMNPYVWSEPSVFRPERFLDPEGHVDGKDRIIPFSIGKRSCLGELLARQEIFLFFTSLLQNFDIRPPEGQDVDCREIVGVTVAPPPYNVRMIPRDR